MLDCELPRRHGRWRPGSRGPACAAAEHSAGHECASLVSGNEHVRVSSEIHVDGRRRGNTNSDCGGVGTRLYLQRNLHTQASQVPGGWVEILRALRHAFLFALRVLVSFSHMAVISSRYLVVYMRRCRRRSSRQHFGGGWTAFWRPAGTEPPEGNLLIPMQFILLLSIHERPHIMVCGSREAA